MFDTGDDNNPSRVSTWFAFLVLGIFILVLIAGVGLAVDNLVDAPFCK